MRRHLANLLLLTAALSISVLLGEFVSRLVVEPVDVLRPRLIGHAILGHAIEPGSGAHDGWGFRNRSVPASADIVAIGDSQTYGVSAPANQSWPALLGQLSERSVYNLALGGYGPAQYFHLLADYGLRLRPRLVIVGFYLGNDLAEAAEFAERAAARSTPIAQASAVPAEQPFLGGARAWLSQRSVLYNLAMHSALGESARAGEARWLGNSRPRAEYLRYEKNGIASGFTPARRLAALDLGDPKIAQGLRFSLESFRRMQALCAERQVDFFVLIIPTKESVYSRYLADDNEPASRLILRALWENEAQARRLAGSFFTAAGIAYVDGLPALQAEVGQRPLYPGNFDGHPNGHGYRVLAEAAARRILRYESESDRSNNR